MRIFSTCWFGKIGIVVKEDSITKERKAYIGVGDGHDEGLDVEIICRKGEKVHASSLKEIIRELEK